MKARIAIVLLGLLSLSLLSLTFISGVKAMPVTPVSPDNTKPFTGSAIYVSGAGTRNIAASTITGSQTLPLATIANVTSTADFTTAGFLLIDTGGTWTTVAYTGKTGTTFTGCTGGTGNAGGGRSVFQAYVNGASRRLVIADFTFTATTSDVTVQVRSDIGGVQAVRMAPVGAGGTASGTVKGTWQVTFPVDPAGTYAIFPGSLGSRAGITQQDWVETDY